MRTPHRFELTLSDPIIIGYRRAAQRMMAAGLDKCRVEASVNPKFSIMLTSAQAEPRAVKGQLAEALRELTAELAPIAAEMSAPDEPADGNAEKS